MESLVLYGEYELIVDEKNRLLIPAEVRNSILPERDGEAFFVVTGQNRKPWLYPEKSYRELVSQRRRGLTLNKDSLDFALYHFGMASREPWDKQWRILLPEKILKRTNTGKEITLVGAGDHLELWNRAEWDIRFEELLRDAGELASRIQQAEQQM